jgi:hypothetical protein
MNVFDKAQLQLATREVERVLAFGDFKHPGNRWRQLHVDELLHHASGHEVSFELELKRDEESGRHNLAHGIARRLMALQKLLEQDE